MSSRTKSQTLYDRLGVRPFINARGTITTLGGSIMPPTVVEAMIEAGKHYVSLNDFLEKAGTRIAELTGAEGAFITSGAAAGMLLAGAACLTGADPQAIERLPEVDGRPNEFVISLVDQHYYIHQGFRVCGGVLVRVGTQQAVSAEDYEEAIGERTAALVFFLGKQPREQLPSIIEVAHRHDVPVVVDAAAQLPPRANLSEITAMGADLVVFSGGKGLRGPQSTGLILGRRDLVRACSLNGNPSSAIGRGMKVGKEEIAGIVAAVELFMEMDEEAVLREWEARCHTIADAVADVQGLTAEYLPAYSSPEGRDQASASPLVSIYFSEGSPAAAPQVQQALEQGNPPIVADSSSTSLFFKPMTLQDGEAEIIASRLREIL